MYVDLRVDPYKTKSGETIYKITLDTKYAEGWSPHMRVMYTKKVHISCTSDESDEEHEQSWSVSINRDDAVISGVSHEDARRITSYICHTVEESMTHA